MKNNKRIYNKTRSVIIPSFDIYTKNDGKRPGGMHEPPGIIQTARHG